MNIIHVRLNYGAGQLPGAPTCEKVLRSHWNDWKYGASDFRFSERKRISPKIINNWGTCPQKCSPVLC